MSSQIYPELYTKNSRIWIKHPEEVWQCATVLRDYDRATGKLYCIIDITTSGDTGGNDDGGGKEIVLEVEKDEQLPPLRNPDILIGANDLTSLSYLHEPSVLYNLRVRFIQHNSIYTWCGIVLVAVNPFCDLEIYGEETIQTYHSNYALSQLDPHIYAVAEDAFTKLERNDLNQSVIVSGESGAGKTVSAKFAMRYFASIAGSDTNIEDRVLASNPIMEAIGNAKTVRNDNSSRFGKYIQILFDRKSRAIMGGNMRTYLLEKSRVTNQGEGERNFHIFYQLRNWAQQHRLDHLGLSDSADEFVYLGSNERTPYDDMTRFVEALETLGFVEKQKNIIFSVIAAILHGGNVGFGAVDDERCVVHPDSEQSLAKFCELLSLNRDATEQWLTNRLLKTGGREIITTPLSAQVAQYGLEALLKFIYEKLFAWIVTLINQSLGPPSMNINEYQFIGVLDIYGFEHFETNSFEQFCINYANEVLQQQFNLHVFKLEQEEYIREGIDWQFITFNDNQMVIDLIETKPIGILALLDEECRMPRGSDQTWCSKLYAQLPVGEVFRKPKFGYQKAFIIQHFADVVTYSVEGFLEKNRDTIWEEQIDLLKRSDVVQGLFVDELGSGAVGPQTKGVGGKTKITHQSDALRAKKKAKATVGHQFRESLEALMKILNSTEPHYVRCIKPNDNKGAFEFNNIRAVQQLRACGVLETIRISSNGFPSRWSYQDFANRYRVLRVGHTAQLGHHHQQQTHAKSTHTSVSSDSFDYDALPGGMVPKGIPKPTPRKLVRAGSNQTLEIRQICEDIVRIVYEEKVYAHFNLGGGEAAATTATTNETGQTRKLYQFGKTKIFFRPGQVALLERIRSQKLRECATLMQRMIRGWLVRRRYLKIRHSVLLIQRYGRAYLARKLYRHLRESRAATIIQTAWRAYHQRTVYLQIRSTVVSLQTLARGYLARKRYEAIRKNLASITIQRYWRGYAARQRYRDTKKKIVLIQSCIRRHLAKKELRRLRIEARSVEHVTNLNKGLEKKIIELQQRLDEQGEEIRSLKQTGTRYEALRAENETLEAELSRLRAKEKEDSLAIAASVAEMATLRVAKEKLESKLNEMSQTNRSLAEQLEASVASVREAALDSRKIEEAVRAREEVLRAEFERERRQLITEREREVMAKQQLLSRYMDLESSVEATVNESRTVAAAAAVANAANKHPQELMIMNGGDDIASPIINNDQHKSLNESTVTPSVNATTATPAGAAESTATAKATTAAGAVPAPVSAPRAAPVDFDTNLQQISMMMRCTELEQELTKLRSENQKLRRQLAKSIDATNAITAAAAAASAAASPTPTNGTTTPTKDTTTAADVTQAKQTVNAGATLLAEQFAEVQDELERYKKERADLKRVILIEDYVTTSGGTVDEKYQTDLLSAYKSLYIQLDEELGKKDKLIHKLKNENIYLKMNSSGIGGVGGSGPASGSLVPGGKSYNSLLQVGGAGGAANGQYLSLDPASLETMDIDPSVCYLGMFKFKQDSIDFIVRFLIYDVGPQNAFKCDAQTIAYITYMCIRYIDHINNDDMIQRFMGEMISMIKKKAQLAITKNGLESIVHVLSFAFKIAILLKYYSEYDIESKSPNKSLNDSTASQRDSGFQPNNNNNSIDADKESLGSRKSNGSGNGGVVHTSDDEDYDYSQALKNFDLTDYTKVFHDLIIWIYLKLVKLFQQRISNLIVPALLEHEELASSGMNVQKSIQRSGSISSERESPSPTEKEIHTLIKELSNIETMFRMHKLNEELAFQFFKQIYYFIGTVALNNLLMRKDLCNNNKAIQIIYNLSYLEQFLREHNVPNWEVVKSMLDAITQANKLLITNKTDKQIPAIIQTTQALTVTQIVKIINMYTASDEEQISPSFIKNLTFALQKDRNVKNDDPNAKVLIMQTQTIFPLRIPYIDETEAEQSGLDTATTANAAVVSGLKVNLKEIELPLLLKGLERCLEKI